MQTTKIQKIAAGRPGPNSVSSRRKSLLAVVLLAVVLVAFAAVAEPAFAADELRLIGIVKTIDPRTGIIFVDVQSESCPGIRRFYTDDLSAMSRYVNQTITFYIDSAICRDTAIHTIKVSWGINK